MELARYGVAPSEVYRDPRPSRVAGLLQAGRAVDARVRLENMDDDVARGGVQGEIREIYPPGKSAPKSSGVKTELVGYKRRREELLERSLQVDMEAQRRAEQAAKLQTVFQSKTAQAATAMRFRIVRDAEGNASAQLVPSGGADA